MSCSLSLGCCEMSLQQHALPSGGVEWAFHYVLQETRGFWSVVWGRMATLQNRQGVLDQDGNWRVRSSVWPIANASQYALLLFVHFVLIWTLIQQLYYQWHCKIIDCILEFDDLSLLVSDSCGFRFTVSLSSISTLLILHCTKLHCCECCSNVYNVHTGKICLVMCIHKTNKRVFHFRDHNVT